jgi:cobalt-zinc-cadmium resistance protein CzcA
MVEKVVAVALDHRPVVLAVALLVVILGVQSYRTLNIEAYPNPVPPLVEVLTQPAGFSAEDVERYVTLPLETALAGMPGLENVRSQSLFGLSSVKCYFRFGVEYRDARQEVLNRLRDVDLPGNLQPRLSSWNATGEVFRYRLRGRGYSLSELKAAQDFIAERQLRHVQGVIDVVGFGGETREYQVQVDPVRLRGHHLTLAQVLTAVANANINVGGQRIVSGEQSYNVRGAGLIHSLRDIEDVVLAATTENTAVRVRDVARVVLGHAPRLGMVGQDVEDDIVTGIVMMRLGANTLTTLAGIRERLQMIRRFNLLPPGMEVVPYYDRDQLVRYTVHTVRDNLLLGMALVVTVLLLFLGHFRLALIAALNIPLALLIAFIGMVVSGTPANLISLGAVDFGIVIDSTVIVADAIFRQLGTPQPGPVRERLTRAAAEVGAPVFCSTLIIGLAFVPLFSLTGAAGAIFAPMGKTYAFAVGGAILLAVTLTPVLASYVLRAGSSGSRDRPGWPVRMAERLYRPVLRFALRSSWLAVGIGLVPVAVAVVLFPQLGREFMPKLEEGNFWIRAVLPASIALEEASRHARRMRAIVYGCPGGEWSGCASDRRLLPEVVTVVSQVGRPDDGTDVVGFNNIELFAPLAHRAWRRGISKAQLTAQLAHSLGEAFPGVVFSFSQAIQDNVEEAIAGIKGENSVKVVGPDLAVDERQADAIQNVLSNVKGVENLGVIRSLGQPDVVITADRRTCGRYGLNTGDVEAMVRAAIGGQSVSTVYDGERRFDLTVRLLHPYRSDPRAIRRLLVDTPSGAQVPLGQVARVERTEGPATIYRENGWRMVALKFSVQGRDLAGTVKESEERLARMALPYDTHLEWAGEIEQLQKTTARLMVIVPLTLLLVTLLVYALVRTWRETAVALASVPVAWAGGVLALLITRHPFSISAAMGFISLLGVAMQDALVVISAAQRLWRGGVELRAGIRIAAERRLRAVLMTGCVALLGLLPAALSRGIGAQTQKPLAIVVIGGALAVIVLARLLQPAMLFLIHRGRPPAGPRSFSPQP